MTKNTQTFNLSMHPELVKKIDELAKSMGETRSSMLRIMARAYLKQLEEEYGPNV